MTPAISVIVPIHGVVEHVGAAIASLRAQSHADFEALVIDDGSTDGSGAAAARAMAGDARFRLIRQDNRGLSAARNRGLDLARGQFIAFLDGDDRYAPQFLARMLAALRSDGGDWVACAVRDCWPDGRSSEHPAIHGAAMPAAARRWALKDWGEVIAHYPSAWNKLYRRDFIGDLRFDDGTWFEDHAFYQQLAARSAALLHLPQPLYWQTRGRVGQITTSDDERIFDQFAVLDRLRGLMAGGKPGGAAAFARLAGRLLAERAPVLRDPDRRARWLARARGWIAEAGITPELPPSLAFALAGRVAVSVQLAPGAEGAALADQDLAALEVVPAGAPLQGATVLRLAPGDRFEPAALRLWFDLLWSSEADLLASGWRARDGGWRSPLAGEGLLALPCLWLVRAGCWPSGEGDPEALARALAPLPRVVSDFPGAIPGARAVPAPAALLAGADRDLVLARLRLALDLGFDRRRWRDRLACAGWLLRLAVAIRRRGGVPGQPSPLIASRLQRFLGICREDARDPPGRRPRPHDPAAPRPRQSHRL